MTALLERFGLETTTVMRRRMWDYLKRRSVDTQHWQRSPTTRYSNEQLAAAVAEATSYAAVLRLLGIAVTGGSHTYIARRIRRDGLDTSHFLGKGHARGKRAPRLTPEEILVVLPPSADRPKTPMLRRALIASGVEQSCVTCGCNGRWFGRPLRLHIDHISGDWHDNRIENLRFLCPNCHAQTATWCRRR